MLYKELFTDDIKLKYEAMGEVIDMMVRIKQLEATLKGTEKQLQAAKEDLDKLLGQKIPEITL